jgi:diguanylate cyclase (GGDEF)-like protein
MRGAPVVILLDVMLGEDSGVEICRQLKTRLREFVPIIMVTALSGTHDKIGGLESGADDYLTKPFRIEELNARIESMLRIKSRHDQVRSESLTDFLTNLPNRRALDLRLFEDCHRAFSCLMIDLDDFKAVNDQVGHVAGDRLLQEVAKFLRAGVGKNDFLARYGGDEFVLLTKWSPQNAKSLAEHIRKDMERKMMITCSIGGCEFPNKVVRISIDLVRTVDNLLFHAKKSGRNRVVWFEAEAQ